MAGLAPPPSPAQPRSPPEGERGQILLPLQHSTDLDRPSLDKMMRSAFQKGSELGGESEAFSYGRPRRAPS